MTIKKKNTKTTHRQLSEDEIVLWIDIAKQRIAIGREGYEAVEAANTVLAGLHAIYGLRVVKGRSA